MSILILDSHSLHARVVKLILSLGSYDIIYYSDTRSAPFDELSGLTRASRLLRLLDTHRGQGLSCAVLLGRGMSIPPHDAVDLGARRAHLELIHAADIIADHAVSFMLRPGGLCLVGDSCLTEAGLRGRLGRREFLEIGWGRIRPMYGLDEPLRSILKNWGRSVSAYVVATPNNERVASQVAREDPRAEIVDEHEHLALALAERLPEGPTRRVRVYVTEQTPAVVERLRSSLGAPDIPITELGYMEPAPTDGPFAMSLDADGCPA